VSTIVEYLGALEIHVDVTRSPDGEISLEERAKNSAGKKLFISIHHDSAQQQFIQYVNGNPCSNKAEGFSIFVSSKNAFFQESLAIARVLGQSLRNSGLNPSRHHGEKIQGEDRQLLDEKLGIYLFDDLIVLKKAQSPALLLEAGVIISPVDDVRIKTKVYQLKIAEAIAAAIKVAAK
jgi:N-acetylmuramoyl-L-alanine amidase